MTRKCCLVWKVCWCVLEQWRDLILSPKWACLA